MDIAVIDCRADDETVYNLENIGIKVIPTTKIEGIYDAVATHADIQIHYLGKNKFICAPEAYKHYEKLMPGNINLIKGTKPLGTKYPEDIAYNVAALEDIVICNSRYTAQEILSEYRSSSKKTLNVKQGYSKCNICIVNGSSVITSDKGIEKSIKNAEGIDVLLIDTGYINLRNMPYGFIGGATGLVKNNILAVNGDIKTHPNGDKIKDFCKKHGVELFSLKSGILTDIGSIIAGIDI